MGFRVAQPASSSTQAARSTQARRPRDDAPCRAGQLETLWCVATGGMPCAQWETARSLAKRASGAPCRRRAAAMQRIATRTNVATMGPHGALLLRDADQRSYVTGGRHEES